MANPGRWSRVLVVGLWLSVLAGLTLAAGCSQPFFRLQSEDESKLLEKERRFEVRTIGAITSVAAAEPLRVYGVGIVQDLAGTGGPSPPDFYRLSAIRDMKQRGVEKPTAVLDSPNFAVVSVSGVLLPGVRKGDLFDVEVEIPPGHKGTSLRGGRLLECQLYEYADTHELLGGKGPHEAKKGRCLAKASGPIVVGGDDTPEGLRKGKVLSGGKSGVDRNFLLILNRDSQDARIAKLIQDRINERFYGPFRDQGVRGMAEAKSDSTVTLKVPPQYRHNWQRYLRVVRNITLRDEAVGRDETRRRLGEELLDPARTIVAALKLEAMGRDSVPELKRGLRSPQPLVQFAAAEALAYLDEPACAAPLKKLIESDERFRAFGLTALASLDEAICHEKLRELMAAPSPETRYGAFRALRALDPRDAGLGEENLGPTLALHRVAADSEPLIHLITHQRPEIVLFGNGHELLPPFLLPAGGDCLITAKAGDNQCIITRVAPGSDPLREPCSFRVDEVIRKLHTMGVGYSEICAMLLEAERLKVLGCPLRVNALPRAISVQELSASGRPAPVGEPAAADLGATPQLFALPGRKPPAAADSPRPLSDELEYVPEPK